MLSLQVLSLGLVVAVFALHKVIENLRHVAAREKLMKDYGEGLCEGWRTSLKADRCE